MPSNELPHFVLVVGTQENGPRISTLFDTDTLLSTGYLPFDIFNKLNNPNTVHIFELYDGMNPFDPITLTGAIDNTQGYDVATHGILSAVIRYFALYKDRNAGIKVQPYIGNKS